MKIFFTVQKSSLIKLIFRNQKDVSWIYLAKDYSRLKRLGEDLGSGFARVDISKMQNEVADDIRASYVQWCDELNELNGENLQWWFTTVSSRNPSESDLFQFACYLELLRRVTDRHGCAPDFVVVESPGLASEILKWAKSRGIDTHILSCFLPKIIKVNYYLCFLFRWIKLLIFLIFRFIAARSTRILSSRNNESGESVIVNTYVHKGDISKEGVFTDRYFPFLHEYLEKSGYLIKVLPILYGFKFNFFSIFKALRRSSQYFIIPEDYLGVFDYLAAVFSYFKFLKQRIRFPGFNGFGMEEVIREEKFAKFTSSLAEAILLYRFFIRMRKKEGSCKKVILWYENQVLHKAIIAGVRAVFPETRIIGAQLFLFSSNILNLFPSESEVEAGIAPDMLLEMSEGQCSQARSFTRSIPCKIVPALRYAHLFRDDYSNGFDTAKVRKNILVLLPFNIDEAIELLIGLKNILDKIDKGVAIAIKTHPDYSPDDFRKAFGSKEWSERFKFTSVSMAEALLSAFVAVSSNSGSMVEAAIKGVP